MFVKSTRFKQVCQLLLSLIVAFYKFIIQIYVNFLMLLLYQAKSHTMDVLTLNRYYYYYYNYYY